MGLPATKWIRDYYDGYLLRLKKYVGGRCGWIAELGHDYLNAQNMASKRLKDMW